MEMRACGDSPPWPDNAALPMSHRLTSCRVSRPRAHNHLASDGHVRGTSSIAINQVAGFGREITVRNANYGSNQGKSLLVKWV